MTPAELAAQEYQEIGYVLFIEGWHVAFTNRHELAGTGLTSWIASTARTVVLGLEPPQSVKLATGIVESGMLVNDGASFTIVDRDGHLIQFNEDELGVELKERLGPLDDPAPDTLWGTYNLIPVGIHDTWVNGESIGADGERRQYQVLPGDPLPGYDHAAIESVGDTDYLRASVLQTAARHMEGRPCALYLIRRDPVTGTWAAWADQYSDGYSLIWWGSVRGLTAEAYVWTLNCDGPSSWLRKTLNVSMPAPADWMTFIGGLVLNPGEERLAIALCYQNAKGDDVQACGTSAFQAMDVITATEYDDIVEQVNTRLHALVVASGDDNTFTDYKGDAHFYGQSFTIQIGDGYGGSPNGFPLAGVLQLRMHWKVWYSLGWDLEIQGVPLGSILSNDHEVEFEEGEEFVAIGGDITPDPLAPGYWGARFKTVPTGKDWSVDTGDVDNDGGPRYYFRLNESPPQMMLYGEGSQVLRLGWGEVDGPYLLGQLAKPPADKYLDDVLCDRAGFIAVRGTYRGSLEDEGTDHYQIARVSWIASSDGLSVATAGSDYALLWVEQWLDPMKWGAQNPKLGDLWAADDLRYVPVALLGYNFDGSSDDRADIVLLRLLLSSGTASWTGNGVGATITSGDNAHSDASGAADDLEMADLGLCIPASMIDYASFEAAAEALPNGKGGALNKTRLAFVGPFSSQEVIEDIILPRGWCFSLKQGKYGIFSRATPLDIDDVEVALTPSDIAGDPDETPPSESVDFRPLEPIDLITVSYGGNQLAGGDGAKSTNVKARDPRAWQRKANATVDINGRSLLSDGTSWFLEFSKLWGEQLARWFAEPHALVTVKVKGNVARDLWPGTIVSYTSPWPATRNGVYGMTSRLGRVVSVERDLQTLAATVEILVDGADPLTKRRFAPIARLIDGHSALEERHYAGGRTITCYADAFGRGTTVSDVAAFVEPAWSTVGGHAICDVWMSWDGVTWEKTASFEVESVNTATNKITYVTDSLTGTIWETRFGVIVLAPYDDQNDNEWPRAVFGVLCDVDGKFGAGDLDGFPWVE